MNPYIKCIRGDTSYKVPTWADGTDEEIAEALEKHYNNEIDLNDYWTVGDERVVHLSAMSALINPQPEQDVTLVLLNQGGVELKTPINEHIECVFVVGQKDCLKNTEYLTASNQSSGWDSMDIKSWLENSYYNSLPVKLRDIFKQHKAYFINSYNSSTVRTSYVTIRLPSQKEIIAGNSAGDPTKDYYNHLDFYKTSENRIKKINDSSTDYWTSTKVYYTGSTAAYKRRFCYITQSNSLSYDSCTNQKGIAPQGVI